MNRHSFFDWQILLKSFRIFLLMRKLKFTFWRDGDFFIGFLNDYPDYLTQAYTKDELLENLQSLLSDIESEKIPFIRKVEELAVAQ